MSKPPFRVGSVQQGPSNKIYCDNGNWRVLRGSEHTNHVGQATFDVNEVREYHGGASKDGYYRTIIGPSFSNDGVIFAKTNLNQSYALGRMLSCRYTERKPMLIVESLLAEALGRPDTGVELGKAWDMIESSGDKTHTFGVLLGDKAREMESEMIALQNANMYDKDKVEFLRTVILDAAYVHLHDYVDLISYAQDHVGDPHPKRELRLKAWEELREMIGLEGKHVLDRLWLTEVLYKMKPDEIAKVGKWARMIGDLGVAASLQGFGCSSILKDAMCKPAGGERYCVYRGFRIYVAKEPGLSLMTEIFDELISPSGEGTFAIFSDDSCVSMRCADGVKFGNLDISGCDASHGPRAFHGLVEIAPEELKKDLTVCIEQLKLKMRVQDVGSRKSKKRIYYKNKLGLPVLYSGSTLTTIANNGANLNIALQAIDDFHSGRVQAPDNIQLSAIKVGYYVTFEQASSPSHIQFLKHSPHLNDEGEYIPLLNIGVLARSSGSWKGDVPGKKGESIQERGFAAQSLLLKGMYPHAKVMLVEAMKEQVAEYANKGCLEDYVRKHMPYSIDSALEATLPLSKKHDGTRSMNIPNSSILERYDIDEHYLQELIGFIQATPPGTQYSTPFVNAVLSRDYGLSCQLFDGTTVS